LGAVRCAEVINEAAGEINTDRIKKANAVLDIRLLAYKLEHSCAFIQLYDRGIVPWGISYVNELAVGSAAERVRIIESVVRAGGTLRVG
jgi:hypothetical protein